MDELLLHEDPPVTEELNLQAPPAPFWMHRAEFWKAEADRLAVQNSELLAENSRQARLIVDLQGQIEALTAKVKDLAHRVFGRKTEQETSAAQDRPEQESSTTGDPPAAAKRARTAGDRGVERPATGGADIPSFPPSRRSGIFPKTRSIASGAACLSIFSPSRSHPNRSIG
jgi:hypothetical protein